MKKCPKCKSVSRHRLKRKPFTKIIPGTKTYGCDVCNTQYTWVSWLNSSFKI
jgi:hypothetical protein